MAELPTYEVTCHTPDDNDADRRIQGLGGAGWWHPLDYLIDGIEGDRYRLWSHARDGSWSWIIVAKRHGVKYLKTEADHVEPDNLLALPHCQ